MMEMPYVASFHLSNLACAWSEGSQSLQTETRRVGCLRLYDKSLSAHPQRSTEKKQRGNPNNTLPRYSQAHRSSHQLIKGLSIEAQRSTGRQRQAGTQVKDSAKGHPVWAPSRAVPGELQPQCPGVTMTHQGDQCWNIFWRLAEVAAWGCRHIKECRGGDFHCCTGLNMSGVHDKCETTATE